MILDELIAREQIRHTLAAYNHAGDSNDADGFAGAFTEDAIFEGPGFRLDGRAAIRAWKASQPMFGAATFRIHHVSGVLIEFLAADRARVRSNWLVTTDIGADSAGRYDDLFRKTRDGWRIAHRQGAVLWRAGNSFLAAGSSDNNAR